MTEARGEGRHRWVPIAAYLAAGGLVSALSFPVPYLGMVVWLPGLATALAVQFFARVFGADSLLLDADELPGQGAFLIGGIANSVVWGLGLRAVVRRVDARRG